MADHEVEGKIGRVTGRIAPGLLGEVMVPDPRRHRGVQRLRGRRRRTSSPPVRAIVVVEYHPPRTVVVTKM